MKSLFSILSIAMKFFATFLLLSALSQAGAITVPHLAARQGQDLKRTGGRTGGTGFRTGGKNTNNGTNATSTGQNSTSVATANNANNSNNANNNNNNNNNNNDPQTSLSKSRDVLPDEMGLTYSPPALDPKVIATGFANNGQDVPTAGISTCYSVEKFRLTITSRSSRLTNVDEQLHQLLSHCSQPSHHKRQADHHRFMQPCAHRYHPVHEQHAICQVPKPQKW